MRGVRAASSWSTVTRNPSASVVGQHHRHAAGERDRLRVRGPVRRGQQHLVAGVEQRLERVVDRVLAAVGHEDLCGLARRSRSRARSSPRSRRAARAARRRASSGGSPGRGRPRPRPRRCASGVGKSGSPAPKPMTSSPRRLERLGLGVDRQRGRLGDGADLAREIARPMRSWDHALTRPWARRFLAGLRRRRLRRPDPSSARSARRGSFENTSTIGLVEAEPPLHDADVVLLVPQHQRDGDARSRRRGPYGRSGAGTPSGPRRGRSARPRRPPSTWMPRAATSVATSTGTLPVVKSAERPLARALAEVAVDRRRRARLRGRAA